MNDVAEANVEVKNRFGLHVRTASMVAKAALRKSAFRIEPDRIKRDENESVCPISLPVSAHVQRIAESDEFVQILRWDSSRSQTSVKISTPILTTQFRFTVVMAALQSPASKCLFFRTKTSSQF